MNLKTPIAWGGNFSSFDFALWVACAVGAKANVLKCVLAFFLSA
jgi:hypothetical protein